MLCVSILALHGHVLEQLVVLVTVVLDSVLLEERPPLPLTVRDLLNSLSTSKSLSCNSSLMRVLLIQCHFCLPKISCFFKNF